MIKFDINHYDQSIIRIMSAFPLQNRFGILLKDCAETDSESEESQTNEKDNTAKIAIEYVDKKTQTKHRRQREDMGDININVRDDFLKHWQKIIEKEDMEIDKS